MNKQHEKIGIAIVSLLILIFGALIGIFFSLNTTQDFILDEEYFEGDFEPDIFGDNYRYEYLTFNQFSNLIDIQISSKEDLIEYLEKEEYEIELEDDSLEAYKEFECAYSKFYERDECVEHQFFYDEEDEMIEVLFMSYFEEDEDE